MSEFKTDDVVECINTDNISLDSDYTYTVNWCNKDYVSIECVAGREYIFSVNRFKLVKRN